MMTLLWDLDGTLIDSMPVIADCLKKTAQHYNVAIPTDEQIRPLIGPDLGDILATLLNLSASDDVQAAKGVYRGFYRTQMFDSPLFPGLGEALRTFQDIGMVQLVATAKYQKLAAEIVSASSAPEVFSGIYGSEADGRLGDKSELLAHILQEEGLKAGQTLMIGDTQYDMAAARAHNLTAIGVLWGYGEKDDLEQAGAHYLVDSPDQLPEVIRTALTCGC